MACLLLVSWLRIILFTKYAEAFNGLRCAPGTHRIDIDGSVMSWSSRKIEVGIGKDVVHFWMSAKWVNSIVIVHKKSDEIHV